MLPAHRHGYLAEKATLLAYLARGYLPYRPRGQSAIAQVDLLLRHAFRRQLVFVEVKYRSNPDKRPYALHPSQQQRLTRVARQLAAHHPGWRLRADVALVAPQRPFLKIIRNAWPLG